MNPQDILINSSAFCLPLVIFMYWSVVGYAALNLLCSQRNTLQNLLLAPGIGFAVVILPVFWLSRLGLPIKHFSAALSLSLLALSGLIFWLRKPLLALKYYLPFALIFIVALCLTGAPLLQFGYDWISYANDDMANYSLGAAWFLQHGYFDQPNFDNLFQGKDYSLLYWFMYVPGLHRAGVELMLAQTSSTLHLTTLQAFMPLILALHLTLISVTGALICHAGYRKNKIVLITCLLLAFSALTTLGTLYQLIAQVAGLVLLIAAVTLILQPFSIHKKYSVFLQSLLIAVIVSALCIVYPEVLPFLCLSIIVYFGINFCKGWRPNKLFYFTIIFVSLFTLLFLNIHCIAIFEFLLFQVSHVASNGKSQAIAFPYYLVPSGFANLWGIYPLAKHMREPLGILGILIGALLTIAAVSLSIRLVFRRVIPAAVVALVMFCLGLNFFIKDLGFGLFKLAMYIQPFLISVIVISLYEIIKNRKVRLSIILFFIITGGMSLNYYVRCSEAIVPEPFSEVAYGSSLRINNEYSQSLAKIPRDKIILSDDFNISLIKFQATLSRDRNFFPLVSPLFFVNIIKSQTYITPHFSSALYDRFFDFTRGQKALDTYLAVKFARFNLEDPQNTYMDFVENNICTPSQPCNDNAVLVTDTAKRSVINSYHYDKPTSNFVFEPYNNIKNHLIFTETSKGALYTTLISHVGIPGVPAFFNLQQDPEFPGKNMQTFGRYLLFRILNPTQKMRLSLSVTNTFDNDGKNKLPNAYVIGKNRIALSLMGRGSAHIFSEPLTPQMINGIPYIAIDMNEGGNNIAKDTRNTTTFAHDISLISEQEFRNLNTPTQIDRFPQSLYNKHLEYTGIYEDGWISEDAAVQLKQPNLHNWLVIEGQLPKLNVDANTLTILIDGKKIFTQRYKAGHFKVNILVTAKQVGRRKIELHFTNQWLHARKPVAAKIDFIGFTPLIEAQSTYHTKTSLEKRIKLLLGSVKDFIYFKINSYKEKKI